MEYLIYDLVLVAALGVFVWLGWKKGLLLSLCGLVVVLLAFWGAGFLADTLDDPIANAVEPALATSIQESLSRSVTDTVTDPVTDPVNSLRDMGGVYTWAADLLGQEKEAMSSALLDTVQGVAQAAARAIAVQVAHNIIFAVAFVLLFVLLTLLLHALDLVAKLPGLHFCNGLGGGLIGLVKGFVILLVVISCLRMFGKLITQEAVDHTYVLKFFVQLDPLSMILKP